MLKFCSTSWIWDCIIYVSIDTKIVVYSLKLTVNLGVTI